MDPYRIQPVEIQPFNLPNALATHYKLNEMQRSENAQNALADNAPAIFGSDPAAQQAAIKNVAAVDPNSAIQLQRAISQMNDDQLKATQQRLNLGGQIAGSLVSGNIPDNELAAATLKWGIPRAEQLGINVDDIKQAAIAAASTGNAAPLKQLLAQKRDSALTASQQIQAAQSSRDFQYKQGRDAVEDNFKTQQMAETARHNRVSESSVAAIALTPESMDMAAEQYLAGDKSVLQGLGRGNAGTAMRTELKNAIYRKALQKGMTGRQIATTMAEFEGLKSGERALGTRTAQAGMAVNELIPMIDQARTAMSNVDRSGFLPWGKIQRAWQDNTNDPNLRRAHAAVEAVVNTWARAINPTGQGTDADKRRGEEMLSTAYDQASFNAVLDQMRQEAMAARASPGATKQEFREGYGQDTPPQAVQPSSSPSNPATNDPLGIR